MSIRKECPLEGYEDCFFEIADKWTRGDLRGYWNKSGDEFFAIYRRKLVSLRLTTEADGVPTGAIVAPADLKDEQIDQVDWSLWRWFSTAFSEAVNEVQRLGEERAQQSLLSTAAKSDSAQS